MRRLDLLITVLPKHQIHTQIQINATPDAVWRILTDFRSYPQWNPFIPRIEGALKVGASLNVRIQPSGTRGMTFRPRLVVVDPHRELRWLGRLFVRGLFDGEHRFFIQPLADGKVVFHQSERFAGILLPLLKGSLDRDTARGFREMNAALKRLAEA